MDTTLEKLKKYFPALPQNAIIKFTELGVQD